MILSPAGLHLIAGFEGYVPHPYNDSAANCTIGYGHLLHHGPCTQADTARWASATQAQLLAILNQDCEVAMGAVNHGVRVSLGIIPSHRQARFDALCSLVFNIGAGAFAASSLLREINRKGAPRDWTPCGPLWIEWDHAGGVVVPGLLRRRKLEFAIFSPGVYPAT